MLGWKNTSAALGNLEKLLICKICNNLVNNPCSLEACDHFFCRACVQKVVGANSQCPECGAFSWIKDLKTNRQLANTVALCIGLRHTVDGAQDPDGHEKVNSEVDAHTVWENTEQLNDDVTDTYVFSSPENDDHYENSDDDDGDAKGDDDKDDDDDAKDDDDDDNDKDDDYNEVNKDGGCNANRLRVCIDGEVERGLQRSSLSSSPLAIERATSAILCPNNTKDNDILKGTENTPKKGSMPSILKYLKPQNRSKAVSSSRRITQSKCKQKHNNLKRDVVTEGLTLEVEQEVVEMLEDAQKKFTQIKPNAAKCQGGGTNELSHEGAVLEEGLANQIRTRGSKRKLPEADKNDKPKVSLSSLNDSKNIDKYDTNNYTRPEKRIRKIEQNKTAAPTKENVGASPLTPVSFRRRASKAGVLPSTPQTVKTAKGNTPRQMGMSSPLSRRNKRGETSLHVAVIKGLVEGVRSLLDEGADPNTRDNAGWTPLHEACNHGHVAIAELLLDSGALVDTPGGFDHDTPLHDAVANNRLEVARLLVTRGAPLDMRNKQGLLPSDYSKTDKMRLMLKETAVDGSMNGCIEKLQNNLPQCADESAKVLLSTGLSSDQKEMLQKCAKKLGGEVVDQFSLDVTHIITAVNENEVCPRTMKYLSGVLNGKWILTFSWISKCLKNKKWEAEEPFEVKGTIDAQVNAPKRARINALKRVPGLFDGCNFFIFGTFDPAIPSKEELAQLIKHGGGKLLSREPKADDSLDVQLCDIRSPTPLPTVAYHAQPNSSQYWCTSYIIYDPLSDRMPKTTNTRHLCTAPFTWLLECISHYQILDVNQQ